jgi:hypothetical protein
MKSAADKPDDNIGHKSRLKDDLTYLTLESLKTTRRLLTAAEIGEILRQPANSVSMGCVASNAAPKDKWSLTI